MAAVEGLKVDAVLAEKGLVVAYAAKKLFLRESSLPLPGNHRTWHALNPDLGAIRAWERATALHLAMLTKHAGQHPLRFP